MNVRNKRVVKKVDLENGIGLELGPLTAPVVTRDDGKIYYLDHMTRDELIEKYKNEPVDPDKIVHIDYVLKGTLKESVKNKKFDYVIASHVIEHIPDTISWLKEVSEILKPGGVLSLVIPDKRFTFDLNRRVTEPSDVVGSYIDGLKKPTSVMMYDFASQYAENIDTASVWSDKDYYTKLPPKLRWSSQEAIKMCIQHQNGEYFDCHCHVYTPESFVKILRELTNNELIDFEVASFLETQKYELEFYASLRKVGKEVSKQSRLRKLPKIHERTKYDDLEDELERMTHRSQVFEREIDSIRNSMSWKITDPLRKIVERIRSSK